MQKLEAVVFDMDGLIIDSERIVKLAWDISGQQLGYGSLGHHMPYTMGLNRADRERYFKEHYGEQFPFDTFYELYHDVYVDYEKRHGIAAKSGVDELLKVLKRRNIKIALATSSSEKHALGHIKRLGIDSYFQVVVCGNQVSRSKPDPQIYTIACRQLDVKPQEAIALEDSYNGIRSAHAAGMMPVMIPDLIEDSTPVDDLLYARFRSLNEVAEWIERNDY